MGTTIRLSADDGHGFDAYLVEPEAEAKAGIIVIQEVFGVNGHIRGLADGFAAQGYAALAPALFDRLERGAALDYSEASLATGRALRTKLGWSDPLRDIGAALAHLRGRSKVGAVGYCWGASLAWLAATRLPVDCAVCYYGAQIVQFVEDTPRCPVMLHFGRTDPLIPPEDVEKIRQARPEVTIHEYPGGHGFNCNERDDYRPESARRAGERTRAFFAKHLA